MSYQYLKCNILSHLLPLFLVSVLVLNIPVVRGRNPENFKKEVSAPTNGTVKTVEGDDGDMVDCVDIYKQPAFNHPLLKDHKLQMNPSSSLSKLYENNSAQDFVQRWPHKNGICSIGTVPVRRRQLQGTQSKLGPHRENAGIVTLSSTRRYYGGGGHLSVWKPAVSRTKDYSASMLQVTLTKGVFLAAGWIVHPGHYKDFQPRFFTFWTVDDSVNTGCFDNECDGFVLVDNSFALGDPISPVSTLGADTQLALRIAIAQDQTTGNWWLYHRNNSVGYWPADLFSGLPEGAESIGWVGQVYDSIGTGQHTETDMGNGLFPDVGTNKASLVCSVKYVDSTFTLRTPPRSMLGLAVTSPLCYDAELLPGVDSDHGQCFLFGGSGRNPKCP